MAPDSARAALDALWVCLIELVEAGHDTIVWAQAKPSVRSATDIARLADEMATLSKAALHLSTTLEAP